MKTVLLIAMVLIGIMGVAQTMDNPILVRNLNGIQTGVWYRKDGQPNVIFCCSTSVPATKEYVEELVTQFRGSFVDPTYYDGKDDIKLIAWKLTETKVLRLALLDVASLIIIEDFTN